MKKPQFYISNTICNNKKETVAPYNKHYGHFNRTTSQPYTTYQMRHEAYTRASSSSSAYFCPSTSLPRDHSPFHPEIGNSAKNHLQLPFMSPTGTNTQLQKNTFTINANLLQTPTAIITYSCPFSFFAFVKFPYTEQV
ncbi:unnamed protein product [Adineta ricciae]|uniref:Uncharacterized protein n=1 Tax=Adineta ricciae TaxID=249248 RepID=A0A815IIY6_ADIRI|nr:unnamed protein product [Adineta ricciae]CAF1421904.1 unnamed protein product [Adineta ricciae]